MENDQFYNTENLFLIKITEVKLGKEFLSLRNSLDTNLETLPDTSQLFDLVYLNNGKIGIGTQNPDMLLTVNGIIHAKEIKLNLTIPVPDYVFHKEYNLIPIYELEDFIKINRHLPDVPSSEKFIENGIYLAEMDLLLLKKIEELTLYLIEQNDRLNQITRTNNLLKTETLIDLSNQLDEIESKLFKQNILKQ